MTDQISEAKSIGPITSKDKQRAVWAKAALFLAILCSIAVPVLLLRDYQRGSHIFPATSDGAMDLQSYAAHQYIAYSRLFGHKIAERRLAQIVDPQPIVSAYRLQANVSDLTFTFPSEIWSPSENHCLLYSISSVSTRCFFLFMMFPLPIAVIMFLCAQEHTKRQLHFSLLFAIAITPSAIVLSTRFELLAHPLDALLAGALIFVAGTALSMIRQNLRIMAYLSVLFQAGTLVLLLGSSYNI